MNKAKYTAGKWEVRCGDLVYAGARLIADCERTSHAQRPAPPEPESEANAALIAAAPDLLEALEGLADCAGLSALPGYKKELDGAVLTARQAIAKAKGGAQ